MLRISVTIIGSGKGGGMQVYYKGVLSPVWENLIFFPCLL